MDVALKLLFTLILMNLFVINIKEIELDSNTSFSILKQAVTLEATGNYGGADVLDNIEPYFSHPEEQIRNSAYYSLRRMDDPKAV